MGVTIDKNDVFIDFNEEISGKSLDSYKKRIEKAIKSGCNKLLLNFDQVESFDDAFLDFIVSLKKIISSINFYNVNMSLLPAFYLMQIDSIASFYTSKYDALNESKPIIKRRLKVVHQTVLMFLLNFIVLKDITWYKKKSNFFYSPTLNY